MTYTSLESGLCPV
uniref:Uncharacterized protein n=1 Tax=Arundo donax TaxID=35708 RepID=A0A0A9ENR8_ARUDO